MSEKFQAWLRGRDQASMRKVILDAASDLMSRFVYYDRKEDEDLRRGDIETAIQQGVVSIDDLLSVFRGELNHCITRHQLQVRRKTQP